MPGMPAKIEAERGGRVRVRTITVGKGRHKRYIRVAVVRRAGPRGGHTVAGPAHTYQETPK